MQFLGPKFETDFHLPTHPLLIPWTASWVCRASLVRTRLNSETSWHLTLSCVLLDNLPILKTPQEACCMPLTNFHETNKRLVAAAQLLLLFLKILRKRA